MPEPHFNRIDPAGAALAVTDARRQLAEGEAAHRELRAALADYPGELEKVFADGGRLTQLVDDGEVRALAVWRVFHTTYGGRRLEIDDLVTREADRSQGYGAALLAHLEAQARRLGCSAVMLNSACHRSRAHRFYFRQGHEILAFHFEKPLSAPGRAATPGEPRTA